VKRLDHLPLNRIHADGEGGLEIKQRFNMRWPLGLVHAGIAELDRASADKQIQQGA
jgi:hypothetical protein